MENIKEIVKKYRVMLVLIVTLIASLFVYLYVSAYEDIYNNQIAATVNSVTIIDGTESFDANDDEGNDSSNNNKRVRNFDKVTYQLSYSLGYKADSTLTEEQKTSDLTSSVYVDILVPKTIGMTVSVNDEADALVSQATVTKGDVQYDYYKYQSIENSISQVHTLDVILSNINGKNGDIISPIIRVREKTDEVPEKEISELTNIDNINKITVEDVTISAKEAYGIELYKANPTKDNDGRTTKLISGVVVYLPQDEQKGIKGIQVPKEVTFNITAQQNVDSTYASIKDGGTIVDYNTESGYVIDRLPIAYNNNNGTSSIMSQTNNNSTFNIKISDLKYHNQTTTLSDDKSYYYLSSKVFTFDNDKTSLVDTNKTNITYTLTTDKTPSNSITLEDVYKSFVGDYISDIDLFGTSNTTIAEDHGKAVFNYDEDFYIKNTIKYGLVSGDKLENGITHYIKIDNTAFKLQNIGNTDNEYLDYVINFSTSETPSIEVKYGLGDWDSSYFKLKENKPEYCPNSLSGLSKEQLMNYYGGPCIEENENVVWVNSVNEASERNKDDKIIIFKLSVLDEVDKGTQITLGLKAKVVNNIANVGNTYQIVSRGKTTFENKDYYLSEIEKVSVANQSGDLSYTKTTYDNFVSSGDKTYIGNTELSNNIGNTILVSPFKSSVIINDLRDVYDSSKTTFYSGMTDPIEISINPVIYKSNFESTITGARITVYLPIELEIYEYINDKKYDRETSGNEVTIDGHRYRVYNYDYSEEDINYDNESASGTIPNLVLHAYIDISIPDNTSEVQIITSITGKLKSNDNPTIEYTDVTPVSTRQDSKGIILRNTKLINTVGKTDKLRIDENGSYTYNMKATSVIDTPTNLALLYILPYSGDGIGDGSNFSGKISVKLESALPEGYTALYTTDNAKTILSNELGATEATVWQTWSDVTSELSNITAIKITSANPINESQYFGSASGINLVVKTNGNKESENYSNNFYMLRYDADICVYEDIQSDCTTTQKGTESYMSNITKVSVFNRTISGYAFEDSDYNGFYQNEPRLSNISVELYKLKATEFVADDPGSYISAEDELVNESITNNDGYYKFENIKSGNYYVKYKFDCNKYTVTEKNKVDVTLGDVRSMDSDAQMINGDDKSKCYAVSNIQTLNNDNTDATHIDLGLRVRQEFDINMNKYITNVKVTTVNGTDSYDYDKQSKVKIDVRNLKTASFRVTYKIEIENTKYFPGTIGNIIETIPEGMTFDSSLSENAGWYEVDGKLYYANLSKTLIMPGEKYYITIVFDLQTSTGGDYINFVVANNLQIQPVTTNFIDPIEEEIEGEDE